jgi:hypothetical protein
VYRISIRRKKIIKRGKQRRLETTKTLPKTRRKHKLNTNTRTKMHTTRKDKDNKTTQQYPNPSM